MKRIIGFILIVAGCALMIFVIYKNSIYSKRVHTFSAYSFLQSTWEKYKDQYINQDGRVLDHSQSDITTSEGLSYALLRSVWIDDQDEFDKVWNFTNNTMKRPKDNLFGWRFGKLKSGKYGFIEQGGINSAADADSDIALSLILASERWSKKEYKDEALKILSDLWAIETVNVNGKRYLIAGNWANNPNGIIVNPSYFSPYAYRVFAKIDKKHDWESLIEPGYELLVNSSDANLDKDKSVDLPPDWLGIDKKTGDLLATGNPSLSTNYSYDAIRVPFRVALDYKWNKEAKASDYLKIMCKFLIDQYQKTGKLGSVYSHNGDLINSQESPAFYGASIGCFDVGNTDIGKRIYEEKIVRLYSNTDNEFNRDISYYDQNWLWFGAAMHQNLLTNYAE
ncbi:MAG TPA: glycosyl hydrolase family 8 [Candidatus Saccharimonadales bacterium]|nr:glycosyl hydrolase family 8 [Candidatus Saccharimonadales bacterium]